MSSREILPYAAPLLYAAMVALTSWLSYRRIMRKYPATGAKRNPVYQARDAEGT